MNVESGYLVLGRFRGVPVRVHVLMPLGALFFSGFRFEPGAWLGFVLIILLHEIGHALLVMRYGLGVSSIDLHAYGGATRWSGQATDHQRSVVAWGGVLAQAALFAATITAVAVLGPPRTFFARDLVYVFTQTNLWLMALNMLPFPPLDGAQAWKLAGELGRRLRSGSAFDFSRWRMPRIFDKRDSSRPRVSPDEARRIAKAFEDAVRRR
jgi:Zn-dependent protease